MDFDDFDAIRRLIYSASGIWLGDGKMVFLQVRLAERLRALTISSAREYYHFLKYDWQGSQEIQQLIDAIAINETWFCREIEPLTAWRDAVVPALLQRRSRLRLWSAGCSTGEEPYTLAMLLSERYPQTALAHFEIVATDISQRAICAARAGVYDPHSLRHTEPQQLNRYLVPVGKRSPTSLDVGTSPDVGHNGAGGSQWVVSEKLRYLVRFEQASLVDPLATMQIGPVEAVFCRNVIIYFDERSRQAALNNFYAALQPGGYLILGHSESLAHTTQPFEITRVNNIIMYRKPG